MSAQVEQLPQMKRRTYAAIPTAACCCGRRTCRHREAARRPDRTRRELQVQIDDLDAELAELADRALLIDRLAGPANTTNCAGRERSSPRTTRSSSAAQQSARQPSASWSPTPRAPAHSTTATGSRYLRKWLHRRRQRPCCSVPHPDQPITCDPPRNTKRDLRDPGRRSRRLGRQLEARQSELRALTSTPASTTDLTSIRARRTSLTREIDKLEKALDEARATLGAPTPEFAAAG